MNFRYILREIKKEAEYEAERLRLEGKHYMRIPMQKEIRLHDFTLYIKGMLTLMRNKPK